MHGETLKFTSTSFGHRCWPSSGCTMKTYQSVIQAPVGGV